MAINEKLIQWGWVDAQGRSLTWRDWQQHKKRNRIAVAYWRDVETGHIEPIYNVLPGFFKRGMAA